MIIKTRTVCTIAGAVVACVAVSGCVGSPTYGTGKTANAHLMEDLVNVVSLSPRATDREQSRAPRPQIVTPPEGAALPTPQTSIASADNPQWPESPEETRERLRAAASDESNPTYRSPLASNDDNVSSEQFAKFREAKAQAKTLSSTRRNLSDPPMAYRIPSETAPADDLGEPEHAKERRRKQEAKKKEGFRIGNLWPF
ncbi:MAG: hypothetical protein AAF724_04370 [Pseudomonadota bacterium]